MTPEAARATYQRMLGGNFEQVLIRRYAGAGTSRPRFDGPASARVVDYKPEQLVGSVQQGDRKLIVMAEDLEKVQWPTPIRKNDKAVVNGKELNIEGVDDHTRRINGVLIAYELQVRG
jgi:hypothetical protein